MMGTDLPCLFADDCSSGAVGAPCYSIAAGTYRVLGIPVQRHGLLHAHAIAFTLFISKMTKKCTPIGCRGNS